MKAETKTDARPAMSLSFASMLTFLDTFAVGVVNPVYPTIVQADVLGATLYAALIATANGGALLAATAFGALSDWRGRRVAIIAACFTTLIGYTCYAFGMLCGDQRPMLRPRKRRRQQNNGRRR